MTRTRFSTLLIAPVAVASLSGCGINSIPTAEENAKARWADVQAAYQRRASLIPNLVATVKGAAGSEERILTGVTEARAKATSINITTDDLSNPQRLQEFAQSQNQLTQALGQLRTVVEAYPDLKADSAIGWNRFRAARTGSTSPYAITTRRCRRITPESAPSPT